MTNTTDTIKAHKAMKPISHSDLYNTDAEIMTACKSIQNRGQNLQRDVHIAACSVLRRFEKSNDVRIITHFFTALPQSYRTNALRDWFSAFGPVKFEQNKAVFVKGRKVELGKAMDEPFWLFSPEKAYVPVDVSKMIDAAIKKLTTDQDKTGKHHGATIAALEAAKAAGKVDVQADNTDAPADPLVG